ncbi:alpha/beta hydrolase [Mesorhizobium sp. M0213]|uniref:alpha/beta fold hydrolase n=1 Tax=Mesorhizobium sp. M0213 TaxID=2956917 RepID=UPI00333E1069
MLQSAGLRVVAVQNPLTSLADDVAATERAIEAAPGDVILVGHSWGGMVITEGGTADKVKALVYVAAFALPKGQSVTSATAGSPPAPWTSTPAEGQRRLPDRTPGGAGQVFRSGRDARGGCGSRGDAAAIGGPSLRRTADPGGVRDQAQLVRGCEG